MGAPIPHCSAPLPCIQVPWKLVSPIPLHMVSTPLNPSMPLPNSQPLTWSSIGAMNVPPINSTPLPKESMPLPIMGSTPLPMNGSIPFPSMGSTHISMLLPYPSKPFPIMSTPRTPLPMESIPLPRGPMPNPTLLMPMGSIPLPIKPYPHPQPPTTPPRPPFTTIGGRHGAGTTDGGRHGAGTPTTDGGRHGGGTPVLMANTSSCGGRGCRAPQDVCAE
mmetsp:Transcript_41766/g.110525  ORF Transcript_41766/g.110525 Transcript_41766/m.110525 type:complete len:219 (+) Transcript_41766:170-826(+)